LKGKSSGSAIVHWWSASLQSIEHPEGYEARSCSGRAYERFSMPPPIPTARASSVSLPLNNGCFRRDVLAAPEM
jgi:hypothetical protein